VHRYSFSPSTPEVTERPAQGDDSSHVVQFYEDDAFLTEEVARFIQEGLAAGEAALVLATAAHRNAFEVQLRSLGVDLDAAREAGRYIHVDAAEALAQLSLDGQVDETRFADVVRKLLDRAEAAGVGRPRVFGEMVSLLCEAGRQDAAIRLEEMWNEIATTRPFSLLCAYPLQAFAWDADGERFVRVCGTHARVIPAESYVDVAPPEERLRSVARLQQKAAALQAVAERTRVEAEGASREKEALFAMLSHELRTPLSAVRSAVVTARLDQDRRDSALEIAQRQTDELSRVVDDLLVQHGGEVSGTPAPRAEHAGPFGPPSVGQPGGRARVVLVEDNLDAAESLGMLLELLGHDVRVVHDGHTALAVVSASVPDVMIVDIGLPGMDGYEVARTIRLRPELQDVELVALTGYGRESDRRLALGAGFDHHFVKPVDPVVLHELIARLAGNEPPEG
jgi:CheY-like chemotaxis protein